MQKSSEFRQIYCLQKNNRHPFPPAAIIGLDIFGIEDPLKKPALPHTPHTHPFPTHGTQFPIAPPGIQASIITAPYSTTFRFPSKKGKIRKTGGRD